jgi:hypothetical protein
MSLRRLSPSGLLLACLLLAPALLAAQQDTPVAPARRPAARPATYRMEITFHRTYRGKFRADRTYTVLATPGQTLPQIRDDATYRNEPNCATPACLIEGGTDIDILTFQPHGRFVTVALRFSLHTFGLDGPDFLPKLPVTGVHQYLATPTLAIGKRAVVYAAEDVANGNTSDVQLLIEPFDPDRPGSLSAAPPAAGH